jgi:two-component system response regulator GlrR
VRFIILTSRDLQAMVRGGSFKSELYYRINTLRIDVPPLARRSEDIPLLAKQMLETFAVKFRKDIRDIDAAVERRFLEYQWPGNVRELECVMKSAIIRAAGSSITLDDVSPGVGVFLDRGAGEAAVSEPRLREARGAWERAHCRQLLSMTSGDVKDAAKLAGMPRESFYRLLRRLRIDAAGFRR